MNTEHIREFVALAECLNYSEAARHLHVSQPSLSKHIAQLERDLNITLFQRDRHQTQLTPLGKIFYYDALKIVGLLDESTAKLASLKNGAPMKLTVEVFLSYKPLDDLIRTASRELSKSYPLLEIEYRDSKYGSPYEHVRSGKVDVCLNSVASSTDMEEFEAIPLFGDPLAVVMHKSNPLSSQNDVSLKDLDNELVRIISAPQVAEHNALVRELLSPNPTLDIIDHSYVDVEKCCEFSFTSGIFVENAGTVVYSMPTPLFDKYRVLHLEGDSLKIVTHVVYLKNSTNPACRLFGNKLKEIADSSASLSRMLTDWPLQNRVS